MGPHILIGISGVVPAVIAIWFLDRRAHRRVVTLVGALAAVPAVVVQLHVGQPWAPWLVEACRLPAIAWIAWRIDRIDRFDRVDRVDAIVDGIRAGLGFALIAVIASAKLDGSIAIALLAAPWHALASAILAGAAAFHRAALAGGYLLVVAIHVALDEWALAHGPLVLAMGALVYALVRRAARLDDRDAVLVAIRAARGGR